MHATGTNFVLRTYFFPNVGNEKPIHNVQISLFFKSQKLWVAVIHFNSKKYFKDKVEDIYTPVKRICDYW